MSRHAMKGFFKNYPDIEFPALLLESMGDDYVENYNEAREAHKQHMETELSSIVQITEALQIQTDTEMTLQNDTQN